ncbi:MAG: PQQ-dependent sugar dehydrogenase [Acidimicrobiia bacterium]
MKKALVILLLVLTVVLSACAEKKAKPEKVVPTSTSSSTTTTVSKVEPTLTTKVMLDGLTNPWDIAFSSNGTMFFTQRNGKLNALVGTENRVLIDNPDVKADGEGGLLGLALDKTFNKNRYLYACYNSKTALDIRVVRFSVSKDVRTVSDPKAIITGIPSKNSGRHSGCRIRTAQDGTLFIGTGDAANSNNPQNPKSLGGKILHVDRDGNGVKGNLTDPFDSRILNYGHRNVQGIALFDKPVDGVYGFSTEHGPDKDDEINLITKGNFGWAPIGDYNENVPMTNLKKFPDAISAIWSSGSPTLATSGASYIRGSNWKLFDGALAVATLKAQELKIIKFSADYKIEFDKTFFNEEFGRIRVATQGPDGNLYIATDDSSNGKIIRITPN